MDGEKIRDEDSLYLADLLQSHHLYEEKLGVGISHFTVGIAPEDTTRCFYVIRLDGSEDDFSFLWCIRLRANNANADNNNGAAEAD